MTGDPGLERGYDERIAAELATYREVTDVHALPAIYPYWREGHVDPLFRAVGLASLGDLFLGPILDACAQGGDVAVLSLGSGNGDLELGLAREVLAAGHRQFLFERLELNDAMRERAVRDAEAAGIVHHFSDVPGDLNKWEPTRSFDVVIANHSLHHVVELEHLLEQVQAALRPGGVFVVNDMIGRNGHLRWPEALEMVQRIWAVMPDRYRYNQQLRRHEVAYENWDCSTEGFEGIRAQDILPLLNRLFHAEVFVAFANVIDLFVDRAFGRNFDPARADDRAFVDAVARLDEAALELGILKPTHVAARYRTAPVECHHVPPFTPSFSERLPDHRPTDALGTAPAATSPAAAPARPTLRPTDHASPDGLPTWSRRSVA